MKNLRLLLLAALSLALAACVSPQVNKDAEVDALIQAAGIEAQLDALQKPLNTQNLSHGGALEIPPDLGQAVNSAISSTLNPANIRADIRNRINSGMSDEQIKGALAFYQSPAGQDVVAVESGKKSDSAQHPTQQTLDDLDSATGTSKLLSTLAEQSIGTALDLATSGKCPRLGQLLPPLSGVFGSVVKRAALETVRENVRKGLNTRYWGLSSDDVNAYLQFAQSSSGAQFFAARNQAFGTAVSSAGQVLAAAIGIEMDKICQQ